MPVRIEVTDREGGTPTWSWDLDGNGIFGDAPDTTLQTLPKGSTDGDRFWEIGVRATDGVNERTRVFRVWITNEVPVIVSLPDLRDVSIDEEYRYQMEVEDPGGALDPIVYTLVEGPEGATIDSEGLLTWTPGVLFRSTTQDFRVDVADGDGGLDEQAWTLQVIENRAPMPPTPTYPVNVEVFSPTPTLRVMNGTDPDGDALLYRFRLDRASSFQSEHLLESADIRETEGETQWTVPVALEPAVYYWQVRVFDGFAESEVRGGRFVYTAGKGTVMLGDGGMPPLPVPDVGVYEPRIQCAVVQPGFRNSDSRAMALAWLALLGLTVRVRTRRRSSV
ncbi:MAG: hypothetical protein KC416_00020 [Myxococcales bacterium]|nr:hypothetical protein [Myxococcales bacterium]